MVFVTGVAIFFGMRQLGLSCCLLNFFVCICCGCGINCSSGCGFSCELRETFHGFGGFWDFRPTFLLYGLRESCFGSSNFLGRNVRLSHVTGDDGLCFITCLSPGCEIREDHLQERKPYLMQLFNINPTSRR